jgi:hypothetical protein
VPCGQVHTRPKSIQDEVHARRGYMQDVKRGALAELLRIDLDSVSVSKRSELLQLFFEGTGTE